MRKVDLRIPLATGEIEFREHVLEYLKNKTVYEDTDEFMFAMNYIRQKGLVHYTRLAKEIRRSDTTSVSRWASKTSPEYMIRKSAIEAAISIINTDMSSMQLDMDYQPVGNIPIK